MEWIISGNAEGEWVVSNGEKTIVYGRGVDAYNQALTMTSYANGKLMVNAMNAERGIVPPLQPFDHTKPCYPPRGAKPCVT